MQASSTDEFKRYGSCISDTQQLFIGDVLLFLSVSRLLNFQHRPIWLKPQHTLMNTNKNNSSDLVELLQKSAVEHLTTYRQLEVREFGSVVTIVTTDFEALYAYKLGDYQRCLQLSTQNVHTLLRGFPLPNVPTSPAFIQLYDDDIVSLIALVLLAYSKCRRDENYVFPRHPLTQLTLSLYLMTRCQLKLRQSLRSLAQTLHYVAVAQRTFPASAILDHLTLKFIERGLQCSICDRVGLNQTSQT